VETHCDKGRGAGGRAHGHRLAAFAARRELKAYLQRRCEAFTNPLVYTFWSSQGPSIMTMAAALAE
jgi:hypothetical protein